MRVVIDTNVLVSAILIRDSLSNQAFREIYPTHILLRSDDTLGELIKTLYKPKLAKYLDRAPSTRPEFILSYLSISQRVEVKQRIIACRDPRDDKFLELAVSGNADVIVSGDIDLLELSPFRNIKIFSPHQFLNRNSNG